MRLINTRGLTFTETHDGIDSVDADFTISEGQERAAAAYLIELLDSGYQIRLGNDLDEGREGCTDFRRMVAGYERRVGGHGWQSSWKTVGRTELIEEIVSLAHFTRPPHRTGWLVERKA